MRVLVANIPLPQNRFLADLNSALSHHVDLLHDHDIFWNMAGDFDVVHLHFPEYLTYKTERACHESINNQLISAIELRLKHWSSRSTLVITRHNLLPHIATHNVQWEKLYEMVYQYVDGVVHFAEPSIEEFKTRYANTQFLHGYPVHCVIPHQNYNSLPNTISRDKARKILGISQKANVILVFGSIRGERERKLIVDSFNHLRIRNKMLLVSRWYENLADVSWIRLKYWLRDLKRLYHKVHPRHHFNYGFVEENDTQLYLNAADVLFIPRLRVLNSGNVALGMTFGKVVVGPDSLNVGHLLKTSGNLVFDPVKPETAAIAIEEAMALAKENKVGLANKQRALSSWSAEKCSTRYIEFFTDLVSGCDRTSGVSLA